MESDTEADDGREDFLSKQEYKKLQENLLSSGFREGASAGKDASFQTGFDAGYAEGFKAAFMLGKFNGVVESLQGNADVLSLDTQMLQNSSFTNIRHGLCQLCKEDSAHTCASNEVKDVSSITEHQKKVVMKALDEQRSKFSDVLEKAGVFTLLSEEHQ